jgi:transcriptional antiterminator
MEPQLNREERDVFRRLRIAGGHDGQPLTIVQMATLLGVNRNTTAQILSDPEYRLKDLTLIRIRNRLAQLEAAPPRRRRVS